MDDTTALLAMRGGGGTSQQMDDSLLQYLVEMGALQPQQLEIARQRKLAEGLRGQSQIPTDVRNAGGRGYQPARSPLEMIAPVMGQIGAGMKERAAEKGEDAYKKARMGVLDKLLSKNKTPGSGAEPFALGGPALGELQQLG